MREVSLMLKLADFPEKREIGMSSREGQVYSRPPTFETYPRALRALIGKCIIHNGIWMAEGYSGSVPIVFPVQEAAPLSTMQQAEARLLCPWILLGIFSLWTLR
jgi:hypothetical protein